MTSTGHANTLFEDVRDDLYAISKCAQLPSELGAKSVGDVNSRMMVDLVRRKTIVILRKTVSEMELDLILSGTLAASSQFT